MYLNALDPRLNPQLLHQLPGLGYVISRRHSLPSVMKPQPGENAEKKRENGQDQRTYHLPHNRTGTPTRQFWFRQNNGLIKDAFDCTQYNNQTHMHAHAHTHNVVLTLD